jgi:ankyrin repeat protein
VQKGGIINGTLVITLSLISRDAKLNNKPPLGLSELHATVNQGSVELVTQLLLKAAPVNTRDRDDETPLAHAVNRSVSDIAKLLIANGTDVNVKNRAGVPFLNP